MTRTRTVTRRLWAAAIALLAVPATMVGFTLYLFGADACGNTLIQRVPSPDGVHAAIVFERSCGATTGFSTHVSVVAANTIGDASGNALRADSNSGAAPTLASGVLAIRATWVSRSELHLSYHPAARVFLAEELVGGIKVTHIREASDGA